MKVDGSLRSLLQGVSQQPPRDRLSGQSTEQINMSSDPVSGLTRRPPTDLVSKLLTSSNVRAWHQLETRNGGKYLASIHDNNITVTDLNGVAKTCVVDANAYQYITDAGEFGFTTAEDKTYVVNKSKTVAMLSTVPVYCNRGAGSKPMAIIQVLGGQYNMGNTITMNGTAIATYQPPNGQTATDIEKVRTTYIATQLVTCLTTTVNSTSASNEKFFGTSALANTTNWTVSRFDDIILIIDKQPAHGSDAVIFDITTTDDRGGINLKGHTTHVNETADLPRVAPQGYAMRVATETDQQEDLWLSFETDSGAAVGTGFGLPGAWVECVAPGVTYQLDTATMPHILAYVQATGTFTFKRGAWVDRNVGTDISNPQPSFVGNTINDVSTFQSRLVLLASSYVILSRTNRPLDFWLGSASALVDGDGIDISSTAVEASIMLSAIPHDRDLVVFSRKGQFVIFGRAAITPANAALVLTTAFEASLTAKPVPAGRNVFFATNFGRFCGMREFYTEGSTGINDTRPITQHVKKYIVGSAERIIASSNYDMLIVGTNTDRNTLYIYQYIWADNAKVLSSWSKWTMNLPVVYSFFDEELLYHVMQQGTAYYLYRQSLDVEDNAGVNSTVNLDARFDVFTVNTQFTLPYDDMYTYSFVAVQGTGCPNPGMQASILSIAYNAGLPGWVVTLKNDMLGGNIVVGTPYRSSYIPTMPLIKDGDGVAVATAKLVINSFIVSTANTGYIAGYMRSPHGDSDIVEYQGRIVGAVDNIVGQAAISDAEFIIPFRENVHLADIEIFSDSYLPMTMLDIEWVGQYTKRGRRISGSGGQQQ
jgi:hypothetical protein